MARDAQRVYVWSGLSADSQIAAYPQAQRVVLRGRAASRQPSATARRPSKESRALVRVSAGVAPTAPDATVHQQVEGLRATLRTSLRQFRQLQRALRQAG